MSLRYNKRIVLAKVEATYGTDPSPAATDAILVQDLELTPLAGETVSRDTITGYYHQDEQLHTNSHVMIKFMVEVAGAGNASAKDTPPPWGALLRGCGIAEVAVADDDPDVPGNQSPHVEYKPISGSEESVTLYFNVDGQQHKIIGARGTFSMSFEANQIPHFSFEFTGLWTDPAAVANVVGNFSKWQRPLTASNINTPVFSYGGTAYALTKFEYEHANEVSHRELFGTSGGIRNEVVITNRKPKASMTIDAPALGAKNWFTSARAAESNAVRLEHGTVAGNIVKFDLARAQVYEPNYSEADGVVTIEASLAVLPNIGADNNLVANSEIEIITE